MNDKEILFNKCMLESILEVMYHGTSRKVINSYNFRDEIKVFMNEKEYSQSLIINPKTKRSIPKYGRSNLDCAYHGFYMTPNFNKAKIKAGEDGLILQMKVNRNELLKYNIICLCLPSYEWAKFIVKNRKKETKENIYDASYCFEMDGIAMELTDQIQKANIDDLDYNLYKSMLPFEISKNCICENLDINIDKFMKTTYYQNLKGFQLCISNPELLKYIELISIINVEGGLINVKE